jgi:hypothetical protein
MVHLITYDLNKKGQNYDGLYVAIQKLGKWWHYLDSNWLVETSYSTSQISEILKNELDNNDNLLVIRVFKDYDGQLPRVAWDWIRDANFN